MALLSLHRWSGSGRHNKRNNRHHNNKKIEDRQYNPEGETNLNDSDRTDKMSDTEDDVGDDSSIGDEIDAEYEDEIQSKVILVTVTGEPYHCSQRCRPIPNTPAWKRSQTDSSSSDTSSDRSTAINTLLRARFINEELGLSSLDVVTEIRTRPRTTSKELHRLYYTTQDIETFRREEQLRRMRAGLFGCNLVRSMSMFDFNDVACAVHNEETKEDVAVTESQTPYVKCVGFVDRADGRQRSSVVTEINTCPFLKDDEKERLFYSSSDFAGFQQKLTEADLNEHPLLRKALLSRSNTENFYGKRFSKVSFRRGKNVSTQERIRKVFQQFPIVGQ